MTETRVVGLCVDPRELVYPDGSPTCATYGGRYAGQEAAAGMSTCEHCQDPSDVIWEAVEALRGARDPRPLNLAVADLLEQMLDGRCDYRLAPRDEPCEHTVALRVAYTALGVEVPW